MSSATLRLSLKKIKSAPKLLLIGTACGVAALVAAATLLIHSHHQSSASGVYLQVGHSRYALEVATTDAEQAKGLGGRLAMDQDTGMLFPFANQSLQCFWMKDMHFPLDIIWVDTSKRITHIEPDLSPSTYPKAYCYLAQYVIELSAGQAAKNHLASSQQLDF